MAHYNTFREYIINHGMYVEGYNYQDMYNTMATIILENIIPIDHFIYTFQQMNDLYTFLTPLILNEAQQIINQQNQNNLNNINNINQDLIYIINNINFTQ
jgi:tRNA G10  N-methylase Trm11